MIGKYILYGIVILAVGAILAWGAGYWNFRSKMQQADLAWAEVEGRGNTASGVYDPAMVAGLPEVAQRYFAHAIAPGTPLSTLVEVQMEGTFLVGDAGKSQEFPMTARQVLSAPTEFVWVPEIGSGLFTLKGSDAYVGDKVWTRFWMFSSFPLVNASGGENLKKAASVRPALEAIWAPAAFLPQYGAEWRQVSEDQAEVTVGAPDARVAVQMRLGADGGIREIWADRWSDANPEKTFRWQRFGGTVDGEAEFGGYTIPSVVHVGNHFGTDDYLAFFNAVVIGASYR